MGEILGIGCSHGPHTRLTDETMANAFFRHVLSDDTTPVSVRDPANWPQVMRDEWGEDEGIAAARVHRDENLRGYRAVRTALDAFEPDFVVMFGDDQYENFKEDLLPPFCIYAMDSFDTHNAGWGASELRSATRPGARSLGTPVERPPMQESIAGSRAFGTFLANELVGRGFDVSCAWKLHHAKRLAHAFLYTVDYLDWDRTGFPYPIIPFHVSCYGSDLPVRTEGVTAPLGKLRDEDETTRPPIAPPPWRCYDLGRAVSAVVAETSYKVAIIGTASWSHASLTNMHGYLWGDVDSDRSRLQQLKQNQFAQWREIDADEMRRSGQHEMRNWLCLAGAMEGRHAEVVSYAETYLFNSSKCAAIFS